MIRLPSLLVAALSLGACVSVLPESSPPSSRYMISAIPSGAAGAEQVAWSLAIEDPTASRAYDTAKIALIREPARIEYYAGGEWSDRAPRLMGAALLRSYENSGRILGVGNRVSMPIADFVLQTDIREMAVIHESGDQIARTIVFARLTNSRGRIYASKLFSSSQNLSRDNAPDAARSLNAGVRQVMSEIVPWSLDEANKAYAK